MGAVIRTQDGHKPSRSVIGAIVQLAAAALAGIIAAAVALGVAELAAALIGPNSAPVIAVGETAINLTPIPVKDFAITHFGSHDKLALIAGILVMLAGFAALIGVAAVRRIGYGLAGLAVFAGLGVTAALRLPGASLLDAVPTLVGVTVDAGALVTLVRFVRPADGGPALVTDGAIGGPGSGQALTAGSAIGGPRDPGRGGAGGGGGGGGGGPGRGGGARRCWARRRAGWGTCCCGGSVLPRRGPGCGCPRRRCARRPYRPGPTCGS